MPARHYLALDLGAESGRAMMGTLDGGKLSIEEMHRFANEPVEVCDTLHWDVLALFGNMLKGMRESARRCDGHLDGIGIDTWAIDFGLLGLDGKLLENPAHYRDRRTEGMVDLVLSRVSREELYARTGLNPLSIHTLFQLVSLRTRRPHLLEQATRFLMMPDLLAYFLTGVVGCERTNAITTQVYDPTAGEWSQWVFDTFDLPMRIMPEIIEPGTILGPLRAPVIGQTGIQDARVVAVCSHDTGSAVAAVPATGDDWVFISSGTWSILGALTPSVVTTTNAMEARACNELTIGSPFLCRNIMGLWLLQQASAAWARAGTKFSYEELVTLAEAAPEGGPLVHPDDPGFLAPPDMLEAIRAYCMRTGQAPPEGPGPVTRCILESLALCYRADIEGLVRILGRDFGVIHIVGGGSRNRLLCQLTADVTGLPVLAGPVEATVAGNVLVQAVALGELAGPAEVREVVRRSTDLVEHTPRATSGWDERYAAYLSLVAQG